MKFEACSQAYWSEKPADLYPVNSVMMEGLAVTFEQNDKSSGVTGRVPLTPVVEPNQQCGERRHFDARQRASAVVSVDAPA